MRLETDILGWIATGLLGLLSFLGASLWYDQRAIADALSENTLAMRELTTKFEGYVVWNGQIHKSTEADMHRLEAGQEKITDRLNRAGVKP